MRSIVKLTVASAAALGLVLGAAPASAEGELKVYNWGEYIAEDTISNFEKEFDVKVTYDTYDSVETADAKLLAGNSGYDVVSHASYNVARLIPAKILMELDKSKLPNFKHIRPEVLAKIENRDPGNKYFVPYMWGTSGVTYNEELVKSVYPDAPIGSLDLVFQPEHMEKIAECGVAFLDSPTDVIPVALAYLGLPVDSTNPDDYKKVEELMSKVRPYIKTFDNYAYQRMPEKEFCVAVTWGPDGLLAMSSAAEADTGVVLDFFLPPGEGAANLWVDGWVIPADAKNVENAHLFLNYMMRPEVAANDSNFTWYATPNKDALPMVDDEVKNNHAAYPTPEQVEMMFMGEVLPPKIERVQTRTWTNIKAGS